MNEVLLHADRSVPALVHGGAIEWLPSPEAGVERRMLERIGGEVAIASTIVRYERGSRFPPHTHSLGEEFVVLRGVFSDEHGDYPAGTYVRNPAGSTHAPFSRGGCVIFVKLRQMDSDEPQSVRVFPNDRKWVHIESDSCDVAALYDNSRIDVSLLRLQAGAGVPERHRVGGEEIFVLEGAVEMNDSHRTVLREWSWYRHPGTVHPSLHSTTGALLWVKRGHL